MCEDNSGCCIYAVWMYVWMLYLCLKYTAFHFKTLIDGLELCGLLVNYCDVIISCLDSHSDGTHSLQRIHCVSKWWNATFSKSALLKKQTHLHLGWPEGEYIFSKFSFLGELYSFKCSNTPHLVSPVNQAVLWSRQTIVRSLLATGTPIHHWALKSASLHRNKAQN